MDLTAVFTLGVMVATVLLAGATVWLVLETRKIRKEEENRRKETAFRAALLELSNNIVSLTPRDPSWHSQPNIVWDYPMKFSRLTELVESMWIDPKLWERIILGSLIAIKRQEAQLHELMTHSQMEKNQNEARNTYLVLDLYLKQLIRYVFCEMQRQKLTSPFGITNAKVFQPTAAIYADLKYSPKDAARLFETGNFQSLPPEPDDKAFSNCRFEVLIAEARQALEAENLEFHQTLSSGAAH